MAEKSPWQLNPGQDLKIMKSTAVRRYRIVNTSQYRVDVAGDGTTAACLFENQGADVEAKELHLTTPPKAAGPSSGWFDNLE